MTKSENNFNEFQRRIAAQAEVSHVADLSRARAQIDAARVPGAAQRLLDRASHSTCSAANSTAAVAGPPASAADLVSADLLGRAIDVAGQLGVVADQAIIAGRACEQAYDALSKR